MKAAVPSAWLVAIVTASVVLAGERDGARLAADAVALCMHADAVERDERAPLLRRGLALAEEAVVADEANARAHFAVFCTLGKLVDLDGLGWRTLETAARVRREVERAVALDPTDVDALVGNGVLLLRLPRMLGGDADEGVRCLERALQLDPWHAEARAQLWRLRGASEPVVLDAGRAE